MASLNRVVLIGRLVAAPELRYTTTGKEVCSFRIAVDRFARPGEQAAADFIPIVSWGKLATICNQYLAKGKLVAIEGRLQTRSYEAQDGSKRSAFEVVADNMQMLSRGEGAGGAGGYRGGNDIGDAGQAAMSPEGPTSDFGGVDSADIPF